MTGRTRTTNPVRSLLRYPLAFSGVLALGLVFGLTAREARKAKPDGLDQAARVWVDAHRGAYPGVTAAFRLATGLGEIPEAILACGGVAILLGWLGRRGTLPRGLHEGTFWLVTLASGLGLNVLLKQLVQRERPPTDGWLVHVRETSFSFPSGHSAFAGLFFGLLALMIFRYARRMRWLGVALCVLGALSVASSRVWLGVHYVTDVVGGLAVGTAWALAAWRVRHRLPTTRQDARPTA